MGVRDYFAERYERRQSGGPGGQPRNPRLDRMARRFTDAYCNAYWTEAKRAFGMIRAQRVRAGTPVQPWDVWHSHWLACQQAMHAVDKSGRKRLDPEFVTLLQRIESAQRDAFVATTGVPLEAVLAVRREELLNERERTVFRAEIAARDARRAARDAEDSSGGDDA